MESSIAEFLLWLCACELQPTTLDAIRQVSCRDIGLCLVLVPAAKAIVRTCIHEEKSWLWCWLPVPEASTFHSGLLSHH